MSDGSVKACGIKGIPGGSLEHKADRQPFLEKLKEDLGELGYTVPSRAIISANPMLASSHRYFRHCAGPCDLITFVQDMPSPLFRNQVIDHTLSSLPPAMEEEHLGVWKV